MRRALSAGLAALIVASPAPAGASDGRIIRHCATKADYARVHQGQHPPMVADELHQKGALLSLAVESNGYRSMERRYRACGGPPIGVMFDAYPNQRFIVNAKYRLASGLS